MARPPVPVPHERDAITEGLIEYEQSQFPDDDAAVAETADNADGMRQVDIALYEYHIENTPRHDAQSCRLCHDFHGVNEVDHNRNTCRICVDRDARDIEIDSTPEIDEPADVLEEENYCLAVHLLPEQLFG